MEKILFKVTKDNNGITVCNYYETIEELQEVYDACIATMLETEKDFDLACEELKKYLRYTGE